MVTLGPRLGHWGVMRSMVNLRWRQLVLLAGLSLLAACTALPIGEYSLDAYKNATSLKAETLALVARSNESYTSHADEVYALNVKIDAAYEFAAGTPNNLLSAKQWDLIRSPDGQLYGTFVVFWRTRGSLRTDFRDQFSEQIAEAFDEIICLEANKQKATSCTSAASSGGGGGT